MGSIGRIWRKRKPLPDERRQRPDGAGWERSLRVVMCFHVPTETRRFPWLITGNASGVPFAPCRA